MRPAGFQVSEVAATWAMLAAGARAAGDRRGPVLPGYHRTGQKTVKTPGFTIMEAWSVSDPRSRRAGRAGNPVAVIFIAGRTTFKGCRLLWTLPRRAKRPDYSVESISRQCLQSPYCETSGAIWHVGVSRYPCVGSSCREIRGEAGQVISSVFFDRVPGGPRDS